MWYPNSQYRYPACSQGCPSVLLSLLCSGEFRGPRLPAGPGQQEALEGGWRTPRAPPTIPVCVRSFTPAAVESTLWLPKRPPRCWFLPGGPRAWFSTNTTSSLCPGSGGAHLRFRAPGGLPRPSQICCSLGNPFLNYSCKVHACVNFLYAFSVLKCSPIFIRPLTDSLRVSHTSGYLQKHTPLRHLIRILRVGAWESSFVTSSLRVILWIGEVLKTVFLIPQLRGFSGGYSFTRATSTGSAMESHGWVLSIRTKRSDLCFMKTMVAFVWGKHRKGERTQGGAYGRRSGWERILVWTWPRRGDRGE